MAYRKIVVGTDGSDTATRAVREAARLAKGLSARLVIVCAFDPPSTSDLIRTQQNAPSEVRWRITGSVAAEEILARGAEEAAKEGVQAEVRHEPGDAADRLIQAADWEDADLIVLGSKGMTGAKRFLLGSVPNKVTHHATCDVLIIRTTS